MSKQARIKRTVAIVPVTAGGFATVDLPRGYDYEAIYLRLTGQVQVTVGATSVRAEAPCQAIPRVDIIADGRNALVSMPYWAAVVGHHDRDAKVTAGTLRTPPSAATAATYTIEAQGSIDLSLPDGERSKDTNFRTSGLQLWQLKLAFGQALDMFVAGAGAAAFVNCTVEISTSELIEFPDPATGKLTQPVGLRKTSYQEIALPTSNANQEIRLPAGNLLKSVMVRTEGAVTAGEPSNAMINNLQLLSGVDVRLNQRGGSLRACNAQDYGYSPTGIYFVDLTRGGGSITSKMSELWDVTNQAEPKAVIDVVGGANNKAQVVVVEILPVGA